MRVPILSPPARAPRRSSPRSIEVPVECSPCSSPNIPSSSKVIVPVECSPRSSRSHSSRSIEVKVEHSPRSIEVPVETCDFDLLVDIAPSGEREQLSNSIGRTISRSASEVSQSSPSVADAVSGGVRWSPQLPGREPHVAVTSKHQAAMRPLAPALPLTPLSQGWSVVTPATSPAGLPVAPPRSSPRITGITSPSALQRSSLDSVYQHDQLITRDEFIRHVVGDQVPSQPVFNQRVLVPRILRTRTLSPTTVVPTTSRGVIRAVSSPPMVAHVRQITTHSIFLPPPQTHFSSNSLPAAPPRTLHRYVSTSNFLPLTPGSPSPTLTATLPTQSDGQPTAAEILPLSGHALRGRPSRSTAYWLLRSVIYAWRGIEPDASSSPAACIGQIEYDEMPCSSSASELPLQISGTSYEESFKRSCRLDEQGHLVVDHFRSRHLEQTRSLWLHLCLLAWSREVCHLRRWARCRESAKLTQTMTCTVLLGGLDRSNHQRDELLLHLAWQRWARLRDAAISNTKAVVQIDAQSAKQKRLALLLCSLDHGKKEHEKSLLRYLWWLWGGRHELARQSSKSFASAGKVKNCVTLFFERRSSQAHRLMTLGVLIAWRSRVLSYRSIVGSYERASRSKCYWVSVVMGHSNLLMNFLVFSTWRTVRWQRRLGIYRRHALVCRMESVHRGIQSRIFHAWSRVVVGSAVCHVVVARRQSIVWGSRTPFIAALARTWRESWLLRSFFAWARLAYDCHRQLEVEARMQIVAYEARRRIAQHQAAARTSLYRVAVQHIRALLRLCFVTWSAATPPSWRVRARTVSNSGATVSVALLASALAYWHAATITLRWARSARIRGSCGLDVQAMISDIGGSVGGNRWLSLRSA